MKGQGIKETQDKQNSNVSQESGKQNSGKKKQRFYILAAEDNLENLDVI